MSASATVSIFVTARDGVSKTFGTMGRSVKTFGSMATSAVAGVLKAFTSLRTFIAGFIIGKAFAAFQGMMEGPSKRQFDTAWGTFRRTVGSVFADLADRFVPHFVSALDSIGSWIDDNRESILDFFSMLGSVVKTITEGIAWMVRQIVAAMTALATLYTEFRELVATMTGETTGPGGVNQRIAESQALLRQEQETAPERRTRRAQELREYQDPKAGWWEGMRRYSQQYSTTKTSSGEEVTPGKTSAAFDRANEAATTFIATIETGLTNALFAMATGAMKASDAIKQMAKSILDDLVKQSIGAFVKMGLGALLGGVVPAAKGGVFPGFNTGFMPLKGYAKGGEIFGSPHVALIGEGRNKEAVVPLPDNRSIPVKLMGNSGGTTIINNQINAVDAQSFTHAMAKAERQHGGVRKLSMGAAHSNRAFRSTFGIRR